MYRARYAKPSCTVTHKYHLMNNTQNRVNRVSLLRIQENIVCVCLTCSFSGKEERKSMSGWLYSSKEVRESGEEGSIPEDFRSMQVTVKPETSMRHLTLYQHHDPKLMPCISTKCGGFVLGCKTRGSSWFSSAMDYAGDLMGFLLLCAVGVFLGGLCHICQAYT